MNQFGMATRRRPKLLARHLWQIRREVRGICSAAQWRYFTKTAREDPQPELLCAHSYHFGFGMLIRNKFLYHGRWKERLTSAAGLWWADADELSGIILTYLVWSVRRHATSLESAREFVKSECWEWKSLTDYLTQQSNSDGTEAPQLG